jgi:glycosyltransferase involved in cell wall biosynthesis
MKIIYFHQYFNTPSMSGGTRSYEFARRLVSMGHEVNMITSYRGKKINKYFITREKGIKIHWIPIYYSNYLSFSNRIITFLKFAWFGYFKAKDLSADLIFASSTPLTISIPGILISKKKNIPLVFEVRDLWPSVPIALKILKNYFICYLAKCLENFVYRYAKAIIVLSPTMKKIIISNNKISPSKIAVIPNSSDLKEFKYSSKLEKDFRKKRHWLGTSPLLLYAGTFGKVNNLQYAVNLAFALNKINSNIKILLVGDGIEKNRLIEESKKKGVFQNNIFFEDSVPKYKMREYFSAATVCASFVINVKETWANSANKFFDTLASGKPIFLNHGGWMYDMVNYNNLGIAIYNETILKVAKKLDSFMNNKILMQKSKQNALAVAKKFFNREILAKNFEHVLVSAKKSETFNFNNFLIENYKIKF